MFLHFLLPSKGREGVWWEGVSRALKLTSLQFRALSLDHGGKSHQNKQLAPFLKSAKLHTLGCSYTLLLKFFSSPDSFSTKRFIRFSRNTSASRRKIVSGLWRIVATRFTWSHKKAIFVCVCLFVFSGYSDDEDVETEEWDCFPGS